MRDEKIACKKFFGGKVIVLGGDFRQILSVIPRGIRSDIVHAIINASHLWYHCIVLILTQNTWLQTRSTSPTSDDILMFSE